MVGVRSRYRDDGMCEDVAGVLDPITKVLTGFMDSDDLLDRIDGIYNHMDTDASGGLNFEVCPSPTAQPQHPKGRLHHRSSRD